MRPSANKLLLLLLLAVLPLTLYSQQLVEHGTKTYSPATFPLFSFDELITLSKDQPLPPALKNKLAIELHAVMLDNSEATGTVSHIRMNDGRPAMRIAEWNIERGENFDWVVRALNGGPGFRDAVLKDNPGISPDLLDKVTEEADALHQAEVIILNEVDLGMGRSNYHNVAQDLATALHMNFVYGVEFVEVDPLKLGTDQITDADVAGDEALKQEIDNDLKSDPARYKGLHGSAILSRYPLQNARIERLPVCYDWFNKEHDTVDALEQGRRLASDKIFMEKIDREIRRGGRIALLADVTVDDAPSNTVTIVDAHLENKAPPACRRKQMRAMLEDVKSIHNPVVLSGDMNTTGTDGTNLSFGYVLKSKASDYRFWVGQAIMWGTPLPTLFPLKYFKNYSDPTTRDIKFLADNKEAALFSDLEKFRFDDRGRFDFRGARSRTINNTGKRLSDSNQRAKKGFVYTFSLPRDYKGLVGRAKLDWFFIKPDYQNRKRTEVLAPWYPRTLLDLNTAPTDRISDHSPILVDLPLTKK